MKKSRTQHRGFTALGVGVFTLLAAAAWSQAAPAAGNKSLRISFERATNRNAVLLHVRVNGRPVLVILDTGSAHTILRPEVVGIKRSQLIPAHASESRAAFSGDALGKEVKLEVGEHAWMNYRVVVMDLSPILPAYQEDLEGVLGLDFLQQFRHVAIDWNQRQITLTR